VSPALADGIVVDWSAASVPTRGADSIWLATGALDGDGPIRTENLATRAQAMARLERHLDASAERGRRVLVAIDCSFGLPAGTARVLGLSGRPPWAALWRRLEELGRDDEANANNRFEVADRLNAEAGVRCFWGRPVSARFDRYATLSIRDAPVAGLAERPLARLRRCEQLAGPGVISNWMLVGKGAVGGQMLTCLPYLERLRRRRGSVAVWPFEGLGDPGADVVLAETWHGLFDWRAERDAVRDQAQVRATLRALRRAGRRGRAALLAPRSLAELSARPRRAVLAEEGWTLGIP
jgi:hypothetical protein